MNVTLVELKLESKSFRDFRQFNRMRRRLYVYIYDLVPKGAHARGYALQLKIKHC